MKNSTQSTQLGQQILQIVLGTPDPQQLLTSIAKTVGEAFQVDTCLVGVTQSSTTELFGVWQTKVSSELILKERVTLQNHPLLKADWSDGDLLAICDWEADLLQSLQKCDRDVFPAGAVLSIRTRFQSTINGAIILGRSQPYRWTHQERSRLKAIADPLAIAIAQAQLSDRVLVASRYQRLLHQISQAMASARPEAIEQVAVAETAQALQVDRGLLLLLDRAITLSSSHSRESLRQTFVEVACEWLENTTPSSLLNHSFRLCESSLCQRAYQSAPAPLIVDGSPVSPEVSVPSDNLCDFDRQITATSLIFPVLGVWESTSPSPALFGFLVFQPEQSRHWQPEELDVVRWTITQVSAAIVQKRALQAVRSLVEDRTAQLQQNLDVQSTLYEKTRLQIHQLQELNHLKDEFMSSMSHELRTPLTAMSLAIRMLRQPELAPERREKYLEILEQQCDREIDLIEDLLSLQRLESDRTSIQPQQIDLIPLIRKLAQSFEEKWAHKALTFALDCASPSLRFSTDPESLHRILWELLTNAGKYSHPNTTVRLKVAKQTHGCAERAVFTLTNIGSMISSDDLNHIFEKFRRGQGVTQQAVPGTGLGLALVKCLVQQLNGTIEVSTCPLSEAQAASIAFKLALPQLPRQS